MPYKYSAGDSEGQKENRDPLQGYHSGHIILKNVSNCSQDQSFLERFIGLFEYNCYT
jgi:hypothetical protein